MNFDGKFLAKFPRTESIGVAQKVLCLPQTDSVWEDTFMTSPVAEKSYRAKACLLTCGSGLFAGLLATPTLPAELVPAAQRFYQEVAHTQQEGLPAGKVQLIECRPGGELRAFVAGSWYGFKEGRWIVQTALKPATENQFVFDDELGRIIRVELPWREVRQLVRAGPGTYLATQARIFHVSHGKLDRLPWPEDQQVNQIALDPSGKVYVASSGGLFCQQPRGWQRVEVQDQGGRDWAVRDVLGVGFDSSSRLWCATRAGVACQSDGAWRFYEGKDGLPWNDFTGIATGATGQMWFGTHLGAIRFDSADFQYRQGPRWLPSDDVIGITVAPDGTTWFATTAGVGSLERRPMTLAQKADFYEGEIERYIKRTPFGFVAEAWLRRPADKTSADPQDSDNDGMWTSMYGAGECFAYAATHSPQAKARAKSAFEALRFLQKVTQDCEHAPPKGYIARSIRPTDWPDPNIGRLASDLKEQQNDKLWKAYEPRWPKSADGKWFWKSDTSSDELDGHFFFYPLYYEFCADTPAERERVREVVRDITDHLMAHEYCLVDFDGKPTRWGIYGPQYLNDNPYWWQERGLKSLSILCYLSVAAFVTGDDKYEAAARQLIERYGYAHNAMYAKVQHGPGSGNQSDDEMAFMCYYGLLHCSHNDTLKQLIRYSFFRYWVNEAPEMNPFFNFAYAAQNLNATVQSAWGPVSVSPWPGWFEDAISTLYGFPLDRLNWPHRNSHRLDIIALPMVRSNDLDSPDPPRTRGYRVNGKVLPVENRHFNHWNTDPWQLDYGGNGGELATGTVFLLPYYMGLYHGFIQKPD